MDDITKSSTISALDGTQVALQDLPGGFAPADAYHQLDQKDVKFSDKELSDQAALAEVVQNFGLAESYMQTRGLSAMWSITEVMLRAYVEPVKWKGSPDVYRSALGIPILAENFYSLLSSIQQAFWSGARNFQIDPAGGTSIDVALAQEGLLVALLKTAGSGPGVDAKSEMRRAVYDGLLYGTGIVQKVWKQEKYTIKKKKRKQTSISIPFPMGSLKVPQGAGDDELEDDDIEIEVNKPMLRHIPVRRFRCAPDCYRGDPRLASWAGSYLYETAANLRKLRDVEGYNIPTDAQLIKLTTPFKRDGSEQNPLDYQGGSFPDYRAMNSQKANPPYATSLNNANPLGANFEIFDYWTSDRHIMILERQYVIYNETHDFGDNSYLGFVFREAPDSFWGWGLGQWLTDFQKIAQGIINSFFDQWSLALQKPISRPMGLGMRGQAETIFPGKVFQVEGTGTVQTLAIGDLPAGLQPLELVSQVKGWAASLSGAGAGVQGSNPGAPGDMRNSSGVKLLASGEALKSQDLMDIIGDQIFIPFLEFCMEQSHRLTPSQIKTILSNELEKAFTGDPLDLINGSYKLTLSTATKLAARQQVNSALGFISSMIQNGGLVQQLASQGIKTNANNFVKVLFEATGFPYREDIFEPMSPQEQQQYQQAQQGPPPDVQGDLTKIAAQGDQKVRAQENNAENKLLVESGKHMITGGEVGHPAPDDNEVASNRATIASEKGVLVGSNKPFYQTT